MHTIAPAAALALFATFVSTAAPEWPQWRGPFNTGMAAGDAPLRWSDTSGVTWKREIPAAGTRHPSSPAIGCF